MASPSSAKRPRISVLEPERDPASIISVLFDAPLERGLLSILLRQRDAYDEVSEIVQAGDFFSLANGYIYHAIGQVVARGQAADFLAVMAALRECEAFRHLPEDRFRYEIATILADPTSIGNAAYHARKLAEKAARLRVVKAADALREAALRGVEPIEKLAGMAEASLFEALARLPQTPTDMASGVAALKAELAGSVTPQATCFSQVDAALGGGLYPGELALLVGMAGHGKTTLALSWLYRRALTGARDVFFSVEMRRTSILRTFLSMATSIRREVLQKGGYHEGQVEAALNKLAALKLHIVDEYSELTPGQVRSRLRRLLMHGPVDLVAIDGLWLMRPDPRPNANANRGGDANGDQLWRDTHDITMRLSAIAKELQVPILLIHQFGKQAWPAREPGLEMLGGGLAGARNADVVLALWKPRDKQGENHRRLYTLKNRHRDAGDPVDVRYNKSSSDYEEVEVPDVPF